MERTWWRATQIEVEKLYNDVRIFVGHVKDLPQDNGKANLRRNVTWSILYPKKITLLLHIYRKQVEIDPHKNLYTNVYNSFFHNIPTLETTQITFNEWVVKQTVVYPYHGILLSIKE